MTDLRMWLKFATQNTLRNRRRSLVTVSIAALVHRSVKTFT